MQSLHVARDFNADAATIFAVISDHAGYTRLPGVRRAYLRKPGATDRNGVGAERVLKLGLLSFVERITEYEPAQSLAYQIIESPLPIRHIGARILLQPLGSDGLRTRVHWTSRLRGTTPVGADLTAAIVARQMSLAYAMALKIWAKRVG